MNFRVIHVVPVVAGLIVALVTVQLGNWQTRRAEEKRDMQTRIQVLKTAGPVAVRSGEPDPAEFSRVSIAGKWLPEAAILLDNRVHQGQPGYEVLMPLRIDGQSDAVLVNRGWLPADRDRRVVPAVPEAASPARIEGMVMFPEEAPFTLADQARDGPRWQYIDLEAFREWSGEAVRGWVVRQTSAADDGLVRDWPAPYAGIDRHRGYALQWYSLAALSLALTGFYVFRSFRNNAT